MSNDLINKILEEIGLEPIESECKEEKNGGICVKQPAATCEKDD